MKYKVGDVLVYDSKPYFIRVLIYNVTIDRYEFKYIESNSSGTPIGKIAAAYHEEVDNHTNYKLDTIYMTKTNFDSELKELLED